MAHMRFQGDAGFRVPVVGFRFEDLGLGAEAPLCLKTATGFEFGRQSRI